MCHGQDIEFALVSSYIGNPNIMVINKYVSIFIYIYHKSLISWIDDECQLYGKTRPQIGDDSLVARGYCF